MRSALTVTASRVFVAALAAFLAASDSARSQPLSPGFYLLGSAPGTTASRAYGISADGGTAAGYSIHTSNPYLFPGYTWSLQGTSQVRTDFGLDAGLPAATTVAAISADGSTVVGAAMTSGTGNGRAFRYRGPGTYQDLGVLPLMVSSFATGVSGDGSVVAGYCGGNPGSPPVAFRWTEEEGMQRLFASQTYYEVIARGVSGDGHAVVGYTSGDFSTDACVWLNGSQVPVVLPALPSTCNPVASIEAANSDASIMVGASGSPGIAAIWRAGAVSPLGTITGYTFSTAFDLSENGGVVVGEFRRGTDSLAAVWTDAGPEPLANYLAARGVVIDAGWTPTVCRGVSADGLTFAGIARSTSGGQQGFVARVPNCGPADWDHNFRVEPADIAAYVVVWSESLGQGTLAGDFDGNGAIEPADIVSFVNAWFGALATGC